VDIGATASCAQGVELTSPTDDIFAAKNLNRMSAGGIASVADGVDAVFDALIALAVLVGDERESCASAPTEFRS